MKHNLYLFLFAAFFYACQTSTSQEQKMPEPKPAEATTVDSKKLDENQTTTESETTETKKLATLAVEDDSQYSHQFMRKLRTFGGAQHMELKGDLLILNQSDSIRFPEIPVVNQSYSFAGKEGDLSLTLTVKRINYTNLEYKLEMKESGKASKSEIGYAELSPFFFLGSESDMDDLTKESYFATEFSSNRDDCYLSIRIGNMEDSPDKPLLAKIIKNCNGEMRDIALDNFPTLRSK